MAENLGYRDVPGTFHPNPATVGILVSICVRCAAYVATSNKDIHDEWHASCARSYSPPSTEALR